MAGAKTWPSDNAFASKSAKKILIQNQLQRELLNLAQVGSESQVQLRIEEQDEYNVDISSVDNLNNSALHYAVKYGHQSIVKMLLDGGAKIDIKNKESQTPMDIAVAANNTAIIELLKNHEVPAKPKKKKRAEESSSSEESSSESESESSSSSSEDEKRSKKKKHKKHKHKSKSKSSKKGKKKSKKHDKELYEEEDVEIVVKLVQQFWEKYGNATLGDTLKKDKRSDKGHGEHHHKDNNNNKGMENKANDQPEEAMKLNPLMKLDFSIIPELEATNSELASSIVPIMERFKLYFDPTKSKQYSYNDNGACILLLDIRNAAVPLVDFFDALEALELRRVAKILRRKWIVFSTTS